MTVGTVEGERTEFSKPFSPKEIHTALYTKVQNICYSILHVIRRCTLHIQRYHQASMIVMDINIDAFFY